MIVTSGFQSKKELFSMRYITSRFLVYFEEVNTMEIVREFKLRAIMTSPE